MWSPGNQEESQDTGNEQLCVNLSSKMMKLPNELGHVKSIGDLDKGNFSGGVKIKALTGGCSRENGRSINCKAEQRNGQNLEELFGSKKEAVLFNFLI